MQPKTATWINKSSKIDISNNIIDLLKDYRFKEADLMFEKHWVPFGFDIEKYEKFKVKNLKSYYENRYKLEFAYDEEQLGSIASTRKNTLVTARAGSWKTQVIAWKVAYLLDWEKLNKSDILLLSFNKKASTEVKERINELWNKNIYKNSDLITFLNSVTFHSLAYNIIKPFNTSKLLIDKEKFTDLKTWAEKEKTINDQLLFIQKCFYKIYSWNIKNIMENDLPFELSQINKTWYLSNDHDYYKYRKNNQYLSLNWNYVRSIWEKYLIDFLFEYWFKVTYEPYININSKWDRWISKPDVKCSFIGLSREIIIEHWWFEKEDIVKKFPLWKDISSNEYIVIKNKKIDYWKGQEKKWNCYFLETSIKDIDYNDKENRVKLFEKIIYNRINDIFKKEWLELKKESENIIFSRLRENEKKVFAFSHKLQNFINKAQQKKWKPDMIEEKLIDIKDQTENSFVIVANEVYKKYLYEKGVQNSKDFNQILEEANNEIIKQEWDINIELNYNWFFSSLNLKNLKYIIIDEYQDFSTLFYWLLDSILKYNPKCKLFVVWDDWQSINAFAWSELQYYIEFRNIFYKEDSSIKSILTNYRSKQTIVEMWNNLMSSISDNKAKWLSPQNNWWDKITFIDTNNFWFRIDHWVDKVFDDKSELQRKEKAKFVFKNIIELISKNKWKSIMFLSRNNRVFWYSLLDWKEKLYYYYSNQLVHNTNIHVKNIDEHKEKLWEKKMSQYMKMVIFLNETDFITAHKSKWKQADIVVLMDIWWKKYPTDEKKLNQDYIYDHIFEIDSKTLLMDERRLFYVALTRAKEKIYVLSDKRYMTDLIKEV